MRATSSTAVHSHRRVVARLSCWVLLTCWNSVRVRPGHSAVTCTPVPAPPRAGSRSNSSRTPWSRRTRRDAGAGWKLATLDTLSSQPAPSRHHRPTARRGDSRVRAPTLTSISPASRSGVELVERPLVPNPALLTTRSIGSCGVGDPVGDGAWPASVDEVGDEHLDARSGVRRALPADRARPGDGDDRDAGVGEHARHHLADPRRGSGDQRRREREAWRPTWRAAARR